MPGRPLGHMGCSLCHWCFGVWYLLSFSAALIKMFSPFGKIVVEDFLRHTRGPKRAFPNSHH
ncbi:hypothetical protein CFP56_003156 [Quercus suber]|uniref:Uncharacterized protein n=1 Tax=Quercus suber TaxID=58331 RepID=A0AAW0LEL6_QUESU